MKDHMTRACMEMKRKETQENRAKVQKEEVT